MPGRRRLLTLAGALAVAALLVAADAASKAWAEDDLRRRGTRSYLGGQVTLRYQTNSGIAFGLFQAHLHPSKRGWLISYGAIMTGGLALVLGWLVLGADAARQRLALAGLVALLAGAAGNLRDRVVRGAVIDFIDVDPPFPRGGSWPAFNLADVYLAIGLVLCAWALAAHWRWAGSARPPLAPGG